MSLWSSGQLLCLCDDYDVFVAFHLCGGFCVFVTPCHQWRSQKVGLVGSFNANVRWRAKPARGGSIRQCCLLIVLRTLEQCSLFLSNSTGKVK
jgi:hypothetical protein